MKENLYCGYVYVHRRKPDAGGSYDSTNWFKWGTELFRELRAVPKLGLNEAAELAMEAVGELNNIEVTVIDVKGLRN